MTNRNTHISYPVEVRDQAYGGVKLSQSAPTNGATTIVFDTHQSHGWYDFRVDVATGRSEKHYAGRVETGEWSISDPAMGRG